MDNNNFKYAFLYFLTLALVCGCSGTNTPENTVAEIVNQIESGEQTYFSVNFHQSEAGETIRKLEGMASFKAGKGGFISNAYFSIPSSPNQHFLQTISDQNHHITTLKSLELTSEASIHLRDSIHSPVMLNPKLLANWIDSASEVDLINNEDLQELEISFQLADLAIDLLWDKQLKQIKLLSVVNNEQVELIWNFQYHTEQAYERLAEAAELQIKAQNTQFL